MITVVIVLLWLNISILTAGLLLHLAVHGRVAQSTAKDVKALLAEYERTAASVRAVADLADPRRPPIEDWMQDS